MYIQNVKYVILEERIMLYIFYDGKHGLFIYMQYINCYAANVAMQYRVVVSWCNQSRLV